MLLSAERETMLAGLVADQPRWRRFLQSRAPRGAEPDDLLQEAFLRAARTPAMPAPERRNAWFYRVLRNVAADAGAAATRAPLALDEAAINALPADPPTDGGCECHDALAEGLTPTQQALVRRVHLEGQPVGQVAAQLGLRPGAAYTQLHRARGQLRGAIADLCGADTYAAAAACECGTEGCHVHG